MLTFYYSDRARNRALLYSAFAALSVSVSIFQNSVFAASNANRQLLAQVGFVEKRQALEKKLKVMLDLSGVSAQISWSVGNAQTQNTNPKLVNLTIAGKFPNDDAAVTLFRKVSDNDLLEYRIDQYKIKNTTTNTVYVLKNRNLNVQKKSDSELLRDAAREFELELTNGNVSAGATKVIGLLEKRLLTVAQSGSIPERLSTLEKACGIKTATGTSDSIRLRAILKEMGWQSGSSSETKKDVGDKSEGLMNPVPKAAVRDGLSDLNKILREKWQPKNFHHGLACILALDTDLPEEQRVYIYRTSGNSSYDEEGKRVLKEMLPIIISEGKQSTKLCARLGSNGQVDVYLYPKIDFDPYMTWLTKSIKQNWSPPLGDETKRVELAFKVLRNGKILNAKIQTSSGIPAADKAGLDAVKKTIAQGSLPALPEDSPDDVDIRFTLDYNVFHDKDVLNPRGTSDTLAQTPKSSAATDAPEKQAKFSKTEAEAYRAKLQSEIAKRTGKTHILPLSSDPNPCSNAIFRFCIDRDGKISDVKTKLASKNYFFNDLAEEALTQRFAKLLKKSFPLSKIPENGPSVLWGLAKFMYRDNRPFIYIQLYECPDKNKPDPTDDELNNVVTNSRFSDDFRVHTQTLTVKSNNTIDLLALKQRQPETVDRIAHPLSVTGYPPFKTKKLFANVDLRGKQAPKLEVQDWLNGEVFDINIEGKVILIDFWATWCGPCKRLIPELNAWQQKYKNDLIVLGISDEPKETLQKFMLNTDMTYSVATDPLQRMKTKIGVSGIPHVLIVSADNIVRWQGYPLFADDRLTESTLNQIIAESKKRYALNFQTPDTSKFINVKDAETNFCQALARKLTQNWHPSNNDRSAPVKLDFEISKNGTIENLNETNDALETVRATRNSVERAKSLLLSNYTVAPGVLTGCHILVVFGSEVTVEKIQIVDW